jgi:hypothetical protein
MEIILAFGVIAFFIWLAKKGRRAPSRAPSQRAQRARTRTTAPISTRDAFVTRSQSVNADDCWVPPGGDVTVAGYAIQGGMLYVGQGLSSITGLRVEPALIDPTLPVKRSNPDRTGAGMGYWPSYSAISPECRAAYLEWLATGRRDPSACIGYVFLYFYGLERRALAQAPQSEQARFELPQVIGEVEQLLRVYNSNNSFRSYATRFLDVLTMLAARGDDINPPTERTGYELPVSLRVGVGRIIAAGKPLPPDWALSWLLTHPETSLRTSVRRCSQEFNQLFRARYTREFGDGLVLKANRSKLRMAIAPASASFGGQVELSMDLPDVAALGTRAEHRRQIAPAARSEATRRPARSKAHVKIG